MKIYNSNMHIYADQFDNKCIYEINICDIV